MSPLNAIHPALSAPACGFSVPSSGGIAYLELHSEVLSNFHNPCSFFVSTWLLCASAQGDLLFIYRGTLCSFVTTFWNSKFMEAFAIFRYFYFLLHFLTPQVWRNRTDEFFSQHATGKESQGHRVRSRLDFDLGSVCCSTGRVCLWQKVVSYRARLLELFISSSSLISNQSVWLQS